MIRFFFGIVTGVGISFVGAPLGSASKRRIMSSNRAPDGWQPDNSLVGKRSGHDCPSCTLCGQPMWYMITLFGLTKMHEGTDSFLCSDNRKAKETK